MTSSKVVLVSSSSNTTTATQNNRRTALVRTDSVASMRARSLLASKGWESFSQRSSNNNSNSTASSRTATKRLQTPRRCISFDVLDPHVIDSSLSCRDNSPLARVAQPENDKDMDGDEPPVTTTTTAAVATPNYGGKHTQATFRARQLVASRSWEGLHFEALLSLDKHSNGNSNQNNLRDNDASDNEDDDDDDDDSTVSFCNSLLDENDEDNDEEF